MRWKKEKNAINKIPINILNGFYIQDFIGSELYRINFERLVFCVLFLFEHHIWQISQQLNSAVEYFMDLY